MIQRVVEEALRGRTFSLSLDLGCGAGDGGALIRPHTARLIGVDLDSSALRVAGCRGIYDELNMGDMRVYPLGRADSFFMFDSIEHVSKGEGYKLLERCKGRFTMLTTPWWSLSLLSLLGAWDGHRCVWSADELSREGFRTSGYSFMPDIPMSINYGGIIIGVRE